MNETLTAHVRIGNEAIENEHDALETLRAALARILVEGVQSWTRYSAKEVDGKVTETAKEWTVRDANGNTVGAIRHVNHDGEEVAR